MHTHIQLLHINIWTALATHAKCLLYEQQIMLWETAFNKDNSSKQHVDGMVLTHRSIRIKVDLPVPLARPNRVSRWSRMFRPDGRKQK